MTSATEDIRFTVEMRVLIKPLMTETAGVALFFRVESQSFENTCTHNPGNFLIILVDLLVLFVLQPIAQQSFGSVA